MKLGVHNYVRDPTSASKYGSDRAAWGVSAHAWNITVCDFLFFGFFDSPTGRHIRPIFTIYTSNVAFSRKKVPFGGLDDEFSHLPPFSPKIWKFALRPMATSNGNNSGIFTDRSKMFAPKWGFSGSGNLTALSKFPSDRPCYHGNQLMIFKHKIGYNSANIQEIELRILHQTGGFQGQAI